MITRLFKEIRKFFAPPEKFTKAELQHFCAGPTKFLHNGAVTLVNNPDHKLHYAIEAELQSRTFLINSAVGC